VAVLPAQALFFHCCLQWKSTRRLQPGGWSGMIFPQVSIPLQGFALRVIFSENRFPLFGITRYSARGTGSGVRSLPR
jgi:hypothetical protein